MRHRMPRARPPRARRKPVSKRCAICLPRRPPKTRPHRGSRRAVPEKPAAPPKPHVPTIAVVSAGDNVISSPAEDAFVSLLQSRGFRVIEGGHAQGERPNIGALVRQGRRGRVRQARPVGSQEIAYYGQNSTLYTVQLAVKAYRVSDGSVMWSSSTEQVNFTTSTPPTKHAKRSSRCSTTSTSVSPNSVREAVAAKQRTAVRSSEKRGPLPALFSWFGVDESRRALLRNPDTEVRHPRSFHLRRCRRSSKERSPAEPTRRFANSRTRRSARLPNIAR